MRHRDGTVSMARGAPGTAAAEFFVCIGDQPELDYGGHRNPDGQGFAAFGRVVQGMEVVRALHARAGAKQWLRTPIAIGPVQRS
ncbi:peptidylprolyl isomerase [Pelomonas aquatica]|uniref:peptidylprolyl isomerase n=1 Tax=Pelomonas aquatica TaxID=431058 RepID=UPI00227A9332|nr:peptidylprolyl isomerase [Pelomonas aquatica]MCY4752819.1 peptidylprolyl isomerase [Pelomonas aquatica]